MQKAQGREHRQRLCGEETARLAEVTPVLCRTHLVSSDCTVTAEEGGREAGSRCLEPQGAGAWSHMDRKLDLRDPSVQGSEAHTSDSKPQFPKELLTMQILSPWHYRLRL